MRVDSALIFAIADGGPPIMPCSAALRRWNHRQMLPAAPAFTFAAETVVAISWNRWRHINGLQLRFMLIHAGTITYGGREYDMCQRQIARPRLTMATR